LNRDDDFQPEAEGASKLGFFKKVAAVAVAGVLAYGLVGNN